MTRSVKRARSYWPAKRDIEYVLDAIGPPATVQVVESILNMTRHPATERMDCLRLVIDTVREIRAATGKSPGKERQRLEKIATLLRRAHVEAMQLSERRRLEVFTAADARFINSEIDRTIGRAEKLAAKIKVKRRSGGGPTARQVARQKGVAANGTFGLWLQWGKDYPQGEQFYAGAELLFMAATGHTGNCKNACADLLKRFHERYPVGPVTKRQWRQMQKAPLNLTASG